MSDPHLAKVLLGILGVGMALFTWACVAFPKIPVSWKGGNRAPLSMASRLTNAVAMTSWCLALTGYYALLWAGLFAGCIVLGMFQSKLGLCIFDGFFLISSLYAVLRDLRIPPHTEEQRILHIMGFGYLVASVFGAIFLYVKRPGKRA